MTQSVVFGVVTGCYLIIATLGFALIARVERFLNIAHAELIGLGGFVTYGLNVFAGWSIWYAAATAIVTVALAATLISRLVYWPIRRSSSTVLLITSVGVLYALQGSIEAAVGPGAHSLNVSTFTRFEFAGIGITSRDVLIVVLAIAAVGAVHLILTKTSVGLQWRALASDEALAHGRGIDVARAKFFLWALVGGLAGLAGVLLGLQGPLTPHIAFSQILLILSVSILAGIGSIYTVVTAALVVGLAMDISTVFIPAGYREAIAFGVVLIVLVLRPEGIAGRPLARREA